MNNQIKAYLGSWNVRGVSHGFTLCSYDADAGTITPELGDLGDGVCVGSVYLDEERGILYCTDEKPGYPFERIGGGRIYAFSIDPGTGTLTELGRSSSYGAQPSYVTKSKDGKYLLVTNYGSKDAYATTTYRGEDGKVHTRLTYSESNLVLLKLNPDGSPGEAVDVYPMPGDGPRKFQCTAHAHCVHASPLADLYAVCDKGADRVYFFRIDAEKERLVLCPGSPVSTEPGTAPRYNVFHPTLPYFYINYEGRTFVTAYRYDTDGRLEVLGTLNSLPEGEEPRGDDVVQSDFLIDPSGSYIYDLHRVVNLITVFRIDRETGMPQPIQRLKLPAATPRGGGLSPDGKHLLVACSSGTALLLPIREDGTLGEPVQTLELPTPGTANFLTLG